MVEHASISLSDGKVLGSKSIDRLRGYNLCRWRTKRTTLHVFIWWRGVRCADLDALPACFFEFLKNSPRGKLPRAAWDPIFLLYIQTYFQLLPRVSASFPLHMMREMRCRLSMLWWEEGWCGQSVIFLTCLSCSGRAAGDEQKKLLLAIVSGSLLKLPVPLFKSIHCTVVRGVDRGKAIQKLCVHPTITLRQFRRSARGPLFSSAHLVRCFPDWTFWWAPRIDHLSSPSHAVL